MLKFVDKRIKDLEIDIHCRRQDEINMEALARFGKIIEVTEEQVFN